MGCFTLEGLVRLPGVDEDGGLVWWRVLCHHPMQPPARSAELHRLETAGGRRESVRGGRHSRGEKAESEFSCAAAVQHAGTSAEVERPGVFPSGEACEALL